MFKKLSRNPFIFFLPFLGYYVHLVLQNRMPGFTGDEKRYVNFADHLMHGFYSTPMPFINLWNGPGYPIVLLPFAFLHTSPLYQTLTNALFMYLAVVFLYKALRMVSNGKIALVLSLLMAIYPSALAMLPLLYTEIFTYFLVAVFIYTSTVYFSTRKGKYAVFAGFILGYLVLTKVIFGYVLLVSAGVILPAFAFRRNLQFELRALKILAIAFVVTLPYLFYTCHLTGKVFYWGNAGGMSLYWMSTPFETEYGDWKVPDLSNTQYPYLYKSAEADGLLKKNHARDIAFIEQHHNNVVQDELYKQFALQNIKQHPAKFVRNYLNNCSRMLFNFPYSYSFQDAGIGRSIIVGASILWTSLMAVALTLYNWRKIDFGLKFILMVTAVYLSLSGLLSAYPRQLDVMLPVFLFWFGYLTQHIKKPNLSFADNSLPA